MGREERARQRRRLLEWGDSDLDQKAFEATYEALAVYRCERDDEDRTEALLDALEGIGQVKGEVGQNADLTLRTVEGGAALEVSEADRDLLRKAINAIRWPGFALKKKRRAIDIIDNAPPFETAAPLTAADPTDKPSEAQ